jgi:hypothetical protein
MVYGQLKNQGLALLKSLYSPGHRTYLDRHGIWVQHENPDRTIVEGKFGGTKTGFRSRYPTVRHGLPEVRNYVFKNESIVQYFQLGPSRRFTTYCHLPKQTIDIRVRVGQR